MLLLHQIGSVKIAEIVRYTVTYTPSQDRILPSPQHLYLRIRNSSAVALRAAFVHGPYALSVAAYPSSFNPNEKFKNPRRLGIPEFEPMLKAGGTWSCRLVVPEDIRQGAGDAARTGSFGVDPKLEGNSVSWIIEVQSQVMFSTSAAVHYEVLLARDEKSLNVGSGPVPVLGGSAQVPQPGRVSDYQKGRDGKHPEQPKGVFSKAVRLKVEDTAALWNTPQLPGWAETTVVREGADAPRLGMGSSPGKKKEDSKPEKVHLVVVTHGLHGNLGGDLLFMKESIDVGVRKAKVDRKARLAKEREDRRKHTTAKPAEGDLPADEGGGEPPPQPGGEEKADDNPVVDDDEEVMVRGFSGNATKTEKGIKFLGKRLAKFVLSMTYPDQPFLPITKPGSNKDPGAVVGGAGSKASHKHSSIHKSPVECKREYQFTKISFIGHSLGGLVQTYAVAYIQKHSPDFFDLITPINFIALATPLLGLNHENPLYVKFALDFGLVGRTGQDLGLTWRAPTIAKSGWGAIVGNLGENAHKRVLGETQPESKPLLRILPTGPAHTALKRFRNRTLYSNVVNDGIVPLRTSCLLFLDWQGLERVEKARREAGLIENIVGFGWAELTGANATMPRLEGFSFADDDEVQEGAKPSAAAPVPQGMDSHEVPQPSKDAILEDARQSLQAVRTSSYHGDRPTQAQQDAKSTAVTNNANPFSGIFDFFKKIEPHRRDPPPNPKQTKIYQRSQVLRAADDSTSSAASSRSKVTTGQEPGEEADDGGCAAPPRTTFFESAADLINPRLPSVEYIIDPSKRPRTIFHDRVYHPSDIPPPPMKKRPSSPFSLRRRSYNNTNLKSSTDSPSTDRSPSPTIPISPRLAPRTDTLNSSVHDFQSSSSSSNAAHTSDDLVDISAMKVEEKIARAYHRGMSWRKVLVKLEPDAHNNIIVRRTFANAFGWPVVAHLVDAHFSDAAEARVPDNQEHNEERARPMEQGPDEKGKETKGEVSTTEDDESDETEANEKPLDPTEKVASNTTIKPSAPPKLNTDVYPLNRVDGETRDVVSDLPSQSSTHITPKNSLRSRRPSKDGEVLPSVSNDARPVYDRIDSVTWSERDWAGDSDDEEQDEGHGHLTHEDGSEKKGQPSPTTLGTSWNWTEKIVGKGAAVGSGAPAASPSTSKPPRTEEGPSASDVD